MISPVYFSIYYVGKSIVFHIIEKNRYINHLSDVVEILQDDSEDSSYLDEFEEEENFGTINVRENEVIDGVKRINKKITEEKKIIKTTKRKGNIKENNND